MNEQVVLQTLTNEGYDKVYVWNAEPFEEDSSHTHSFDTKLVILDGEIVIEMSGRKLNLIAGHTIEIPRHTVHSGFVGPNGCRYVVAEKH